MPGCGGTLRSVAPRLSSVCHTLRYCKSQPCRRFSFTAGRAEDPYSVLGVARGCSNAELKQAFRRAAKQWHPDMQGGGDASEAERMFKRVSWAYETAVAQRSGSCTAASGMRGAAQRSSWQHRQQGYQRHHRQEYSERSRQENSERMRSEHIRASAFIERIKGSVLASAVLLCVLFSGTPSSRDDIFSPVRRLLGTQRDVTPAAGCLEMQVDEVISTPPKTQHTRYPAQWMADAVNEEMQRHPSGYGAPMGAAGVALAKAEWLSRQSRFEKYSTAVEDIADAQQRAWQGKSPLIRQSMATEDSRSTKANA